VLLGLWQEEDKKIILHLRFQERVRFIGRFPLFGGRFSLRFLHLLQLYRLL